MTCFDLIIVDGRQGTFHKSMSRFWPWLQLHFFKIAESFFPHSATAYHLSPNKRKGTRKVDVRLPGKGNSTPVAQGRSTKIISMIMWTRTSRLSIKISLSHHLYGIAHVRLSAPVNWKDFRGNTSLAMIHSPKFSTPALSERHRVWGFWLLFWGLGCLVSVLGFGVEGLGSRS